MIEALKHELEVAIHGIETQTIENVLNNWVDRMGYCKASRGIFLIKPYFWKNIHKFFFIADSNSKFYMAHAVSWIDWRPFDFE